MQRIAIDVRMAHHTGIGRYIRGTVSSLDASGRRWQFTLIGNRSVRKEFQSHVPFIESNVPIYSVREQFAFLNLSKSFDCFHIPHYNASVLWPRKLIVTVHDLIHLHFARDLNSGLAQIYARTMLPLIVHKADAIIAVSEHTKKDLVETLRVRPEKITVIYHGVDPIFLRSPQEHDRVQNNGEPYFLYVGLIKKHKNLGVLLRAFRALKNKMGLGQLHLKLVGTPDLKQKIVREWLDVIHRETDIFLTDNLSDLELREVYAEATALVFPSLYEGFGFPLLEALASHTPVIASHATSVPEILGEKAALYFDPSSVSELETCMERILQGADLREQLVREGLDRLALFNWRSSAEKTEKLYESVVGSGP